MEAAHTTLSIKSRHRITDASALIQSTILGALIVLSASSWSVSAQTAREVPAPAPLKPAATARPAAAPGSAPVEALKPGFGPTWNELTPAQQRSLTPLAPSWNSLEVSIKRKWLVLAANYPSLTPAEQAKLHSRMSEWSQLSKQERAQARLNFAESKKVSPDQKAATWEAYQALTPEEKKKLAASAPPKLPGAAGAAKPVVPQKLATVPLTGKNQTPSTSPAPAQKRIDNNTLLPVQPEPAVQPTPFVPSAPPVQGVPPPAVEPAPKPE